MEKSEVLQRIGKEWLCMIMRGDNAEETLATCEAIIAGGAVLVEVAFTTPDVDEVLRELSKRYGDQIVLSAGTVRTPKQAETAIECGAHVIVSPDVYAPVVEAALSNGRVSAPGCFTPTDIGNALRLGADIIKLFPSYPGGPDYIRYIHGPFPEAQVMVAGGISDDNLGEYHQAGAFAAVVGVPEDMKMRESIKAHRYDEVTAAARQWLALAHEVRKT